MAGHNAGSLNGDGYRSIRINRQKILAHRLAFLFMLGRFPQYEVDHVNLDRADNRWCNLREAAHTQNNANRRLRRNSMSRLKGLR